MDSQYIEYNFQISPKELGSEILIAELGERGFESFVETEEGVLAYIQQEDWNADILEGIYLLSNPEFTIDFSHKEIEPTNWNEEWEKNFNPIVVEDICAVRAPFHEPSNTSYEIVIQPKMSFGTGHHQTTYMMLQYIFEQDFTGKSVLDMGCGTAILSIAAALKGSTSIEAIDIDPWCFENATETVELNHQSDKIHIALGDAALIKNKTYDVIIANINRNILLADMPAYRESLTDAGQLFLSGFYQEDIPMIEEKAKELGLHIIETKERDRWVALRLQLTKN